ncbi:MAG TPA: hypothetical protein PKA61_01010 [Nitrospira sp.]|nr:hypothetical protein [Nitrospira sp.]
MSAHARQGQERSRRSPIETQIHRRKKALALSPLEPEWDGADQAKPVHLRMPSVLMASQPKPLKQPPDSDERDR